MLAMAANVFTLFVPGLIARGIDNFVAGQFEITTTLLELGAIAIIVGFFTAWQNVLQTIVSEQVAMDLRGTLADRIAGQGYRFIEDKNPARLLTNLTSDIDSIKLFVSLVIPTLVTSVVVIVGTSVILLMLDWELAAIVLLVIPLLGGTFFVIMGKMRPYFMQGREVIDWLNRVIRESIIGAALVRLLDTPGLEQHKFNEANRKSRDLGFRIVRLFSLMVPIITFVSNMSTLAIVTLGGWYVIQDEMSLGTFTAFINYVALLIFPILMIGFMTNIIAQASASHTRIAEVLNAPQVAAAGTHVATLQGDIRVRDLSLDYGGKPVLRNVSLDIPGGSRTAILGPTAAGKTQLLNLLAGLSVVQQGSIEYDGKPLVDYDQASFFSQVGLVFQDSVLFNTTMRENIAFSVVTSDAALQLAIDTAELGDYVASLPEGLETRISERGTTLSGGQKQRIMLARALVQNPRILYLDDFTARVDASTEQKILANITRNYPGLTLVSITQQIAPVTGYDQIILLMEGEVLARGTHEQLLHSSPEYVQIYNSQRSTSTYELRA
jgi:ATP-binding cassette subfamily B protein